MAISPFQNIPILESEDPLVDIETYAILCEPVYYNQGISTSQKIYLRKAVVTKLIAVQKHLPNHKLLVWDGLRSRDVQNKLYDKFYSLIKEKNPNFLEDALLNEVGKFVTPATDPNRIPPHSTGAAVDLTLVEAITGIKLDMGTEFDDLTELAATHSKNISAVARGNRQLLLNAMETEGFVNYPEEWWHFSFGDQLAVLLANQGVAIYGEVLQP